MWLTEEALPKIEVSKFNRFLKLLGRFIKLTAVERIYENVVTDPVSHYAELSAKIKGNDGKENGIPKSILCIDTAFRHYLDLHFPDSVIYNFHIRKFTNIEHYTSIFKCASDCVRLPTMKKIVKEQGNYSGYGIFDAVAVSGKTSLAAIELLGLKRSDFYFFGVCPYAFTHLKKFGRITYGGFLADLKGDYITTMNFHSLVNVDDFLTTTQTSGKSIPTLEMFEILQPCFRKEMGFSKFLSEYNIRIEQYNPNVLLWIAREISLGKRTKKTSFLDEKKIIANKVEISELLEEMEMMLQPENKNKSFVDLVDGVYSGKIESLANV